MSLDSDGGMILTGENRRTRRRTCSSAILSTTSPTWIDPDANPGLCGERPATNDLSHGTAEVVLKIFLLNNVTEQHIKLKLSNVVQREINIISYIRFDVAQFQICYIEVIITAALSRST
jgi:hypothetical protein